MTAALLLVTYLVAPTALAPQTAPYTESETATSTATVAVDPTPELLKEYLDSKNSPLAAESNYLVSKKHWRLLVAISAIESQFGKRLIDYNAWGLGGDTAYQHYNSYRQAADAADALIEKWQRRGRWLTVRDMNGSFVVPFNPSWEQTVNKTLAELEKAVPEWGQAVQ